MVTISAGREEKGKRLCAVPGPARTPERKGERSKRKHRESRLGLSPGHAFNVSVRLCVVPIRDNKETAKGVV